VTTEWQKFYEQPVTLRRIFEIVNGQKVFLDKIIHYGRGGGLLETGIGSGIMSIYLSSLGHRVIGLDKSSALVERARALSRTLSVLGVSPEFVTGDTTSLPFESESFAVCFHQGVFEHFDDDRILRALKEQLRVARFVVFSVPTVRYPCRDVGDERLLPASIWRAILRPFRVIDAFGYNFGPSWLVHALQRHVPQPVLRLAKLDEVERGREIGFVVERGITV
jgi:SAM-dependent methyltransferase